MKKFYFIAFLFLSTKIFSITNQELVNDSCSLISQDKNLMNLIVKAKDKSELDKKEKNSITDEENNSIFPAVDSKVQIAFRNKNLEPLSSDKNQYNVVKNEVEGMVDGYIHQDNPEVWLKRRLSNTKYLSEKALEIAGPLVMFHQLNEMRKSGKKEEAAKKRDEETKRQNAERDEKLDRIEKNQNEILGKNKKNKRKKEENTSREEKINKSKRTKENSEKEKFSNAKNQELDKVSEIRENKALDSINSESETPFIEDEFIE